MNRRFASKVALTMVMCAVVGAAYPGTSEALVKGRVKLPATHIVSGVKCTVYDDCVTRKINNMPTKTTADRLKKAGAVVVSLPSIFTETVTRAFACAYSGPGSRHCKPY